MTTQLAFLYGVGERDRILAAMRSNHSIWLQSARSFARVHAMIHGEVRVDDLRKILAEKDFPMPADIGMKCGDRIFGVVLSGCRDFEPLRQELSTRPERIARSGRGSSYITVYRLKSRGDRALHSIAS